MAEQKTKSIAKKVATKAGSAVAAKPKAAKAGLTTAVKKVVAKKVAAPVDVSKKAKAPAVKKVAAPSVKAKAPTVKKVAVPSIKKEAPAKKVATARKKSGAVNKAVAKPTPEERYRMVQTAAYFIAERNGFQGCSTSHWIDAEKEIAEMLR